MRQEGHKFQVTLDYLVRSSLIKGVEEESAREKVTHSKLEDGDWGRRGGWASVLLNAFYMFERHLSACLLSM